jgi:GR25 family glycosyltransferase involved in LPS biosynthesis
MIPIFCINLERATERKKHIQKEWIDKLGFDITFWKAYDRRDIEQNKIIYPYDKHLAIKMIGRELNTGEIACATSFCMLYHYIIKHNYKEVIVMEDDVTPLISDRNELYNNIYIAHEEFDSYDILLLHNIEQRFFKKYQNVYYDIKSCFSRYRICPWGNQMLYLKLSAVKKIYSKLIQMYCPADYPQQELSAKELIICGINNPLCYHIWDGRDSKSYIQNQHRKTRRKFIK